MSNMVLLVVDVQNALINAHPYNEHKVIENIRKLILAARENKKEILFVRHDDGKGTELEIGTDGWQIYNAVAPKGDELIFEKQYNSAFHKTDLKKYLDSQNIETIILVGLQTEYCIDATCKSAFDYDYKVVIPEETNTTFDNDYLSGEKLYEFYNFKIWNKRFADVMDVEEVIRLLENEC
ncbi:cysteine hydrolase family protein [Desulfosporosinus sp. PR]|uniref:cysteine hydrolase family protein n=1 Tax=Candidatus Desulfosporosinus nitrosoreducens TaxID=3401928 RepID=UPI0027E674FD|nr:cysteine hydrolase family protein [Desulfosporosinus sp. PR]MDQ7094795.1 cysteine hydrolase family protein [Desulfosporosinus sp. PR]